MRNIEIIVDEDSEIVSVNDFFTFSVKYHNLSSRANVIPESDKVIVGLSTTGIWILDDNKLLIEESSNWRDVSENLSFFLEWQNEDSIHSPISLRMLFDAIVDSLKHDSWKTFGTYQDHSIRIFELCYHYNRKNDKIVPEIKSVEINSPIVRKRLVSKQWLDLPFNVKTLILLTYEDREGNFTPQYWDGSDYIQREIILQNSLNNKTTNL